MVKIKEAKNIIEEAQFLKEKQLDYKLVKIYSGELSGSEEERRELARLKEQLKGEIFVEVIYILTHRIMRNAGQAKRIYFAILSHREKLKKSLKRNVGIEVATLDYLKNFHPLLEEPEIIEKGKLLELAAIAITDEVTRINGRTTLYVNLEAEVERSKRYGRPLSLLFCDFDDFKKINDNYGHAAGDAVLKETSEIMRRVLRSSDDVCRYGGDEFVCIMPETDIASALLVAERMRTVIVNTPIKIEEPKTAINVSVSIGVAQFGNSGITDKDILVSAADKMMYLAKQDGKNCVRVLGDTGQNLIPGPA